MSVALRIKDETPTGDVISESIVQFPVERITVQELIEARVSQEVEAYNDSKDGEFMGLIQPTESEAMLNGYRLVQGKQIDVENQKQVAVRAFQSNGFFLLVNDQQLTELDNVILITPNTVVGFLKLVPLVGG
jgi:hypothetical protein